MTVTPESRRSLAERLDTTAEAWKPEPGDKIVGEVIDVDSRTTEFGTYPIVTLRTDEWEELAIHGFHTVLKREFSKARPEVGDRIGVKYLGKHERGYESYRVVRERAHGAALDWDAIGAQAEQEGAAEAASDDFVPEQHADDDVSF